MKHYQRCIASPIIIPYLWNSLKLCKDIRVGDKGKSSTGAYDVLNIDVELKGEVTQDGKDSESSKEGGEGVREGDDPGVSVGVMMV